MPSPSCANVLRRKPNIEVLQEVTAPLRDREKTLRTYHEQLLQIDLEQMRKEDEEMQEKEGNRTRDIK